MGCKCSQNSTTDEDLIISSKDQPTNIEPHYYFKSKGNNIINSKYENTSIDSPSDKHSTMMNNIQSTKNIKKKIILQEGM